MVVARRIPVQNPPMELRQLRDFLAVLDARGFTAAAQRGGKSQQAISKSVQALEHELGVQLLDRQPRLATATSFGRLLEFHARAALDELATFESTLHRLKATGAATVRLGASPTAAAGVVGEAVLAAVKRDPALRVAVLTGLRSELLADLGTGQLDLCICVDTEDAVYPGVSRELLGQETYGVVVNAGHPLLQADQRPELSTLASAEWVVGTQVGEVEQAWRDAFVRAGLAAPIAALTTSSLEFCRNVLRSSNMLIVLPLQLVETELDRGEFGVIDIPCLRWQRPLALYRPRGAVLPPVLLDSLRRAVEREARLAARRGGASGAGP